MNPEMSPYALVVGLCAHGIAIVQALAAQGVKVVALEHDQARSGCHTCRADVIFATNINTDALIDSILDVVQSRPGTAPVLYLTNDNMVRVVGRNWHRLEGKVRLSWADSRDAILRLLDKGSLAKHCEESGLNYPKSWLLEREDDLRPLEKASLSFPMIMKPTVTLTGFKVRLVKNVDEVHEVIREFPGALPVVLQQWIPGGDRSIRFCAMYLEGGCDVASFTGRKLGAVPPAMGQATIAEPFPDGRILDIGRRFFAATGISGPVALEVKLAPDGTPWVIEPNVGRTEYLVDCCISNGVNFPYIEYLQQSGAVVPATEQQRTRIWFDIDRAPLCYARFVVSERGTIEKGWSPVFPYGDPADPEPRRRSRRSAVRRMIGRAKAAIFG